MTTLSLFLHIREEFRSTSFRRVTSSNERLKTRRNNSTVVLFTFTPWFIPSFPAYMFPTAFIQGLLKQFSRPSADSKSISNPCSGFTHRILRMVIPGFRRQKLSNQSSERPYFKVSPPPVGFVFCFVCKKRVAISKLE